MPSDFPVAIDQFARPLTLSAQDAAQAVSNLASAIEAVERILGTTTENIGGKRFHATATITSAAAATPVSLVLDASVPTGMKCYLQGFLMRVNGTTVWATTANVKIQDTNGTPVDFATVLVALLTNQARIGCEPKANLTLEDAFSLGTGGTASKGLSIVGDANGTGSDLVVSVWGIIR